jgi:hypothetical protein
VTPNGEDNEDDNVVPDFEATKTKLEDSKALQTKLTKLFQNNLNDIEERLKFKL